MKHQSLNNTLNFSVNNNIFCAKFVAMANPCSIFIEQGNTSTETLQKIAYSIAAEAWRIEQKYSRYLNTSVIYKINNNQGDAVLIDNETFSLLTLADTLWRESAGKFDISSGIFRKIWTFNQQKKIPTKKEINQVLKYIGWEKVDFDQQKIILPKGMQIDFGGIGKEYATDRCASLATQLTDQSILINLGGDIAIQNHQNQSAPWKISIESKEGKGKIWKQFNLSKGAVATSGDVYKSFTLDGKRYGHIINALTGYPIEFAPRTVTVIAPNCSEAGILTTLSILEGKGAEYFLQTTGRAYWIQT